MSTALLFTLLEEQSVSYTIGYWLGSVIAISWPLIVLAIAVFGWFRFRRKKE